jgi:hypothetical protein
MQNDSPPGFRAGRAGFVRARKDRAFVDAQQYWLMQVGATHMPLHSMKRVSLLPWPTFSGESVVDHDSTLRLSGVRRMAVLPG